MKAVFIGFALTGVLMASLAIAQAATDPKGVPGALEGVPDEEQFRVERVDCSGPIRMLRKQSLSGDFTIPETCHRVSAVDPVAAAADPENYAPRKGSAEYYAQLCEAKVEALREDGRQIGDGCERIREQADQEASANSRDK